MNFAVTTVFETANQSSGSAAYEVVLVSEHGGPVANSLGYEIQTASFQRRKFDTLLMAGGMRPPETTPGLLKYLRSAMSRTRRIASIDRIQTALAYAKENLNARLSVQDLAGAAFLSPRQFSRLFTEETGQSPARAIERLRVEAAHLMMEAGRFSVQEIARKTGFGNRERMRQSFIRAFGQPPQTMQRVVRT